jgi:cardiolipin synthase
MNIGREYRYDWHDMMVEMRGPIVGVMRAEFKRSLGRTNFAEEIYGMQGDAKGAESKAGAEPRGAFEIRLLRTRPFNSQIESAIHLAIEHVQRRIWIEDPYLADDRLISALIGARKRGIDVRVILPKKSDAKIMSGSNKVTAAVLLKHGVRVFKYPGVHHVKASLYDDWALLGSANMDHLSLRVNDELNIAYSNPAAVRELETKLFMKDFKVSKEQTMGTVKPTQRDRFDEVLADRL